jgi:hypothetical protein
MVTCQAALKSFAQQMAGRVEAQQDNVILSLWGGGIGNATAYQRRPSGKHCRPEFTDTLAQRHDENLITP